MCATLPPANLDGVGGWPTRSRAHPTPVIGGLAPPSSSEMTAVQPRGHVVAVRVTSEDPDNGFKPASVRVEVSLRDLNPG